MSHSDDDEERCPGPECGYCSGEACAKCGAGCWSYHPEEPCEHDVLERHEYQGKPVRGPGSRSHSSREQSTVLSGGEGAGGQELLPEETEKDAGAE